MTSSKKITRFRQKQREANDFANSQVRLSFFSKLNQRLPAKVGVAAISALIVLHFVSQFIFFQNEIVQDEIALPNIENQQIAEVRQEFEPVKSEVVSMPEPFEPPDTAQPENKPSTVIRTVKKKQSREYKAERPRRADRVERDFRSNQVASVFPYGRFLVRSSAN